MRHSTQHGFVFLFALFTLLMLVGLATTGMLRSVHTLVAITRTLTTLQELHTAEGGVDDALKQLASLTTNQINELLPQPPTRTLACALPNCTITVQDNIAGSIQDTDSLLLVTATATVNGVTQTIRTTIEVPRPVANAFNFVTAGWRINVSGNASIGDASQPLTDRGVLYVGGEPGPTGAFLTTNANDIWATRVDFSSSLPLAQLCTDCSNQAIFHGPPAFNQSVPSVSPVQIDLQPYYNEAVAEGHVISADTTYANATLTGVYYIECNVTLTLNGTITVNGTLVHEGCNKGNIALTHDSSLTIDSTNAGGPAFAKGFAIIGAPSLQLAQHSTIDITGFVMTNGTHDSFKADGIIRGGLIGVTDPTGVNVGAGPGPGTPSIATYPFNVVVLAGGAHIVYSPLPGTPPGFQSAPGNGVTAPTIRVWQDQ